MATRTWSSAASTDLNDVANYSGSGAFLTTDDLVFDNTSVVNATATESLSVNSVTVAATYSGNMTFSGYSITCANGNVSFDGIGTLNLGNGITMSGASATFHVGSGVGTVTATSCVVTMNGTTAMVIDDDKGCAFKMLILGVNAKIANNGNAASVYSNVTTPFIMGASSSLVNNKTLKFVLTGPSAFTSLGSGYAISGSQAINFQVGENSITVTLPSITTTNTPLILVESGASKTGWTFQLTGAINAGTANLDIAVANANSTGTFDFNGQNIICGSFRSGAFTTTNNVTLDYSSGTFSVTSFAGSVYNASCTISENFQSSQWTCSGNWTFGSNHTIDPGTSKVTITNTSTITSNAKLFYDLIINASGKTITLADALSVHDFTVTEGTLTGNFSTTCSGDASFSVSTTLYRLIMTKATSRTITVLAGGTLTLSNVTDTNLNGSAGALTQWRSTILGTAFNLSIPGIITLTYQNPQDSAASAEITANDGTSLNWGGNTNWTFPTVSASRKRSFIYKVFKGD